MTGILDTILRMSLYGALVGLAALAVSRALNHLRAPKGVALMLWAIAALRLLCPAIFHVSVFIFFLGGIFRQFGGIFYNVGHKLLEVKRIFFCDNGLAGFRFKSLPRNAGHFAATLGNLYALIKTNGF